MPDNANRIRSITIENTDTAAQLIIRDRETALRDLQTASVFHPLRDSQGPYDVALSVEENRLVIRMDNAAGRTLPALVLSLKPYRRLIKDYFLIVGSFEKAIKDAGPSRIEAIDIGRRAVHNEGASLLAERLADKIVMDLDTARRLFTLICVLQAGSPQAWR